MADDALDRGELIKPVTEPFITGNGYFLVASKPCATTDTERVRQAFAERS